MKEYFKLVRPDYKSFFNVKFQWPVNGIVEVPNAAQNGPCGHGLHLVKSVKAGLNYAKFPFRILKVRPLGPVLGEDDYKIRVGKAESFGEIPIPMWAKKIEDRITEFPKEVEAIPWFRGTDKETAVGLLKSHFKLLTPFGLNIDWKIEVVTNKTDADAAWKATRDFTWNAASAAISAAAKIDERAAARDVVSADAWTVARVAVWAAVKTAVWDAARDAARDAAKTAAWATARNVARDAAWAAAWTAAEDLLDEKNPFKPLWEVWKLGAWPIGFVDNKFFIYAAE